MQVSDSFPVVLLLGMLACSNPSEPSEPELGTLSVTTITSGDLPPLTLDEVLAGGYRYNLQVTALGNQLIRLNETLEWKVGPGQYELLFQGPSQCRTLSPNPRTVSVAPGGLSWTVFRTICDTVPSTGSIQVQIETDGTAPDSDGYLVALAGHEVRSIGVQGQLDFADLSPGTYTLYLSGLAENCFALDDPVRSLEISRGSTLIARFRISCPAVPEHSLLVTVRTSFAGTGWSPNFNLRIDGGAIQPIPANGYLLIGPLVPGYHTVAIQTPSGGGSFCLGGGGGWPPPPGDGWSPPRTVRIPDDGWGRADYSYTCIP